MIGGGGHGLATAYYLASRHGIATSPCSSARYIGSGGTGRNTTVLRANYKTPETIPFFKASFDLYRHARRRSSTTTCCCSRARAALARALGGALRIQRERALLNQALGVDTRLPRPGRGEARSARSST